MLSKAAGGFLIVLGAVLMMVGVAVIGYFFYVTARDHEQQPPKQHDILVNIGLLTVLPTILFFLAAYLPQNYVSGYKIDEFAIGLFAVLVVAFAVFRGNIARFWRNVLPIAVLYMFITTGSRMMEFGKEMNGKGYNYLGNATVTGFESIVEGELSLLTVQFTNKDKICITAIELNCTDYNWKEAFATDDDGGRSYNWNEVYEYQRRDDAKNVHIYYEGYSDDDDGDDGLSFTCEYGFDENADDVFPYAYNFLGNWYSCDAAWYTNDLYQSSYYSESPMKTMIMTGISATILAAILFIWRLCCADPKAKTDPEEELLEDESGVTIDIS